MLISLRGTRQKLRSRRIHRSWNRRGARPSRPICLILPRIFGGSGIDRSFGCWTSCFPCWFLRSRYTVRIDPLESPAQGVFQFITGHARMVTHVDIFFSFGLWKFCVARYVTSGRTLAQLLYICYIFMAVSVLCSNVVSVTDIWCVREGDEFLSAEESRCNQLVVCVVAFTKGRRCA